MRLMSSELYLRGSFVEREMLSFKLLNSNNNNLEVKQWMKQMNGMLRCALNYTQSVKH